MFLTVILFLSALSISAVSAFYSITGLTEIFPALVVPVIILGVALEIGKLSGVAFLHNNWKVAPLFVKAYLITAIIVLMLINSMGIFGLLSKGHIEQQVANSTQTSQIELILPRIESKKQQITQIDSQMSQINDAINKLTNLGRATSALQQIQVQHKQIAALSKEKESLESDLDSLNKEKIDQQASNLKTESDFGPLKYLTDIFYTNPNGDQLENIVRWIISIIVFVTDPMALILLISASFTLKNKKYNLTGIKESSILHIGDFD